MDFAGGRFGQRIFLTIQRIIACMLKWSFILLIPVLLMADNLQKDGIDVKAEAPAPCKSYYNSTLKKQVYTQVEIEPEYGGGTAAYQRFLNKNMQYPQEGIDEHNPQDRIEMKFIVDTDGSIIQPRINDKTDTTDFTPFEKEMVRVLKLTGKWQPGICQGKKVAAEKKASMVVCFSTE
jgi:protein TonB